MRKKEKIGLGIIVCALIVIICLVGYIFTVNKDNEETKSMDLNQTGYVKPETPMDRSQNVTLPGWGSFTIAANTKNITSGFEFHNPDANYWYEDTICINNKELENLVVDSGAKVELNHYLSLAGIDSKVKSVKSYDKDVFSIEKNEYGNYTLEGIGGFNGKKKIKVETENGNTKTLTISCKDDCYYMTFALYLTDGDELLYQSDLVAHGNYITKMEMTKALKKGTYDAYIVIQPYKSDKKTETNSGIVNITLNVE